ncbi:MAG: NAD-dependent epimerase/dehydratase family protein [Chloroflexi bacterium]|nr:NAD-dependent epimerase/dehydratase family protein [Chloroflexota bacterium]
MADPIRIVVTGGAGFIGSHVVDALIERGNVVGIVDSLVTGNRENLNPRAEFFEVDICDAEALAGVLASFKPQVVDHHAAQISVALSSRDPAADALTNVVGSLQVLEASRAAGVEHLVFASTGGALYGDPEVVPADEATPIAPLSPYGAAKASVETYLRMYHDTYGFSYTALRYANVFGPRQTPEGEAGVVAIFTNRMLKGETPVIFGDGDQQRDFVYVGDVAQANVEAIERRLQGAYNVGTGVASSVNEVTRELTNACGFEGIVEYAEERPGEVRRVTLDAAKLTRETGWQWQGGLAEGLALTVGHQKARANRPG